MMTPQASVYPKRAKYRLLRMLVSVSFCKRAQTTVIFLLFTLTLVCLLPRYKLIVSDFIVAVGYVHSKVLKKLNPLALSIHIPAPSKPKGPEAHNPNPIPSQIVYVRVLRYLGKLAEAEWRT